MSGGSMDYLFCKLLDASFQESTPKRKALRKHLVALSAALKAVEWNDSLDGDDQEDALLDAVLKPGAALECAIEEANRARAQLTSEIERVERVPK